MTSLTFFILPLILGISALFFIIYLHIERGLYYIKFGIKEWFNLYLSILHEYLFVYLPAGIVPSVLFMKGDTGTGAGTATGAGNGTDSDKGKSTSSNAGEGNIGNNNTNIGDKATSGNEGTDHENKYHDYIKFLDKLYKSSEKYAAGPSKNSDTSVSLDTDSEDSESDASTITPENYRSKESKNTTSDKEESESESESAKSSLLEDYADVSQEMPDYFGGED
jgi:hypothetical protein